MSYVLPHYWRTTLFGTKGLLETSATSKGIFAAIDGQKEPETIPLPPANPGGYLRAFIADVRGEPRPDEVDSPSVLRAARLALIVQKAADERRAGVSLR